MRPGRFFPSLRAQRSFSPSLRAILFAAKQKFPWGVPAVPFRHVQKCPSPTVRTASQNQMGQVNHSNQTHLQGEVIRRIHAAKICRKMRNLKNEQRNEQGNAQRCLCALQVTERGCVPGRRGTPESFRGSTLHGERGPCFRKSVMQGACCGWSRSERDTAALRQRA